MSPLFIACLFLVGCSAAPSGSDEDDLVLTDKFFMKDFVIYSSKHDIVKLYVPLNQFNFDELQKIDNLASGSSEEAAEKNKYTVFFVEADVTKDETKYQGLYVFKNGIATKLVDNGRDAVANHENVVFIATEEGLYKYDEATNTAAPFGTIKDSIIQLAHNNKTNEIYLLTEDHKVLKLNEDGSGEVVPTLKDVEVMVFGFEGNMYYSDSKNDVYVYDILKEGSAPEIAEGWPSEFSKLVLLSNIYGSRKGALVVVDERLYVVNPTGMADALPVKFEAHPTASAPQPTLIQYYAKDKKIYQFNVLYIALSSFFTELNQELKPYLDKNKEAFALINKASNV